jgi:2-polyprenyl-3-methyl-5-hydroxy-6-metoxy-1,4-benzoquinol methylase
MNYAPLIGSVTRVYESVVVRTYIAIRFRIINTKILDTILNYISPDRRLLVLGCGFGLFDCLVGMRWPEKQILGVDRDEKRIAMARGAAERLGLTGNTFEIVDLAEKGMPGGAIDEILMLDILHHIPRDQHESLLRGCYEALTPGGYLIIKDIHRDSRFKLFFTWLLDMLMTSWEPVFYREEDELGSDLKGLGFDPVVTIRINDLLPYPHIQYVCIKPRACAD